MFEQPETSRKPYSMVLSLILQIVLLGALCLVPFLFPQMLPTMRLKTLVLGAPPKPPVAVKTIATSAHAVAAPPRSLVLIRGPLVEKPAVASAPSSEVAAPGIEGAETASGVPYGIGPALPEPLPPAPPVVKPKPQHQRIVRVGGAVSSANLIHMVQPTYPALARATRVQGTVEFTAIISKEGAIENLQLVHGHPLLVNAAKDAVLQWRYRPTLLNGEPVEVITDIVVNFALSQ
jgi:protein TonB